MLSNVCLKQLIFCCFICQLHVSHRPGWGELHLLLEDVSI